MSTPLRSPPAHYDILTEQVHNPAWQRHIEEQLQAHDSFFIKNNKLNQKQPANFYLLDQAGVLSGGLCAEVCWEGFFIHTLWITAAARGQGHGKALLEKAAGFATAKHCRLMLVQTTCFNNLGFYQKSGFRIEGRVEDFPVGFNYYFLTKNITR